MTGSGTPAGADSRLVRACSRVARVIDVLGRGLSQLGGLLIVLLMLMIVVDVAMRAMIGRPLPGTIGFSQVIVAVAIYLAFAHTQRTGSNIRVELVLMRVPPGLRTVFEVVSRVLVAAASALLAYYAVRPAMRSIRVNEHWVGAGIDVPMWPARFALVVGAGVLALAAIRMMLLPTRTREDEDVL